MSKSIELYRYAFRDEIKILHLLDTEKQETFRNSNIILKWHDAGTEIICNQKIHLILFEALPDVLEIDFVIQELKIDVFYIIPSDHFCSIHLNTNCQYFSVVLTNDCINDQFKMLLNHITYRKNKIAIVNKTIWNLIEHDGAEKLANTIIDSILNEIVNSNTINMNLNFAILKENEYNLGNRFLQHIQKNQYHLNTTINYIANKLGCCERTLQRACLLCFNANPKTILKHHVFINSLHELLNKQDAIETIAARHGFANQSSFCKFIKRHSHHSPKVLRKIICWARDI
jgi:AraC-like DNA-binding protein